MNCPACHEPLIVLEHDAIEIDFCDACRGVWLDRAELDLLFSEPQAAVRFLDALTIDKTTPELSRKCPICGTGMDKVSAQNKEPVLLDRCPRGHGVWLDKGELNRVLSLGENPSSVAAFLCSVFGS